MQGRKGSGEVEWERNFVPWGNSVVDSCQKKKGGAPREAWRGELRIVDMSGRADDSSSSTFGRPYSPRFLLPRHNLIWSREAEPDPLFVGDEPNRRSFLLS